MGCRRSRPGRAEAGSSWVAGVRSRPLPVAGAGRLLFLFFQLLSFLPASHRADDHCFLSFPAGGRSRTRRGLVGRSRTREQSAEARRSRPTQRETQRHGAGKRKARRCRGPGPGPALDAEADRRGGAGAGRSAETARARGRLAGQDGRVDPAAGCGSGAAGGRGSQPGESERTEAWRKRSGAVVRGRGRGHASSGCAGAGAGRGRASQRARGSLSRPRRGDVGV